MKKKHEDSKKTKPEKGSDLLPIIHTIEIGKNIGQEIEPSLNTPSDSPVPTINDQNKPSSIGQSGDITA